jgi:hypothetical protein
MSAEHQTVSVLHGDQKNTEADRVKSRQSNNSAQLLAIGLAVVGGLLRLVPHPWNFTPLGALGLFGGARLRLWQALTLPIAVMVVTDLILWAILGWPPFNPIVYTSFLISVLLGRLLTQTAPGRIAACALAGSIQFFLLTNFGVWYASSVDPQTIGGGAAYETVTVASPYPYPLIRYAANPQGLAACYWLALAFSRPEAPPFGFFGNLLVGDLFFTALLFASHAWVSRRLLGTTPLPALR